MRQLASDLAQRDVPSRLVNIEVLSPEDQLAFGRLNVGIGEQDYGTRCANQPNRIPIASAQTVTRA
ncbi:hypothetical protein [Arthrobacter alpinus]|uniref:hypothetical protein n=1 Tax=Arthrobacter alpinus TaxID=656366 RepID=UPI001646A814|nr:hypothetical protein [Arthrobacter alpinus]